ncbi:MAG: hypothetical protein U0469_01710 [Candidatus Paceibacterota bacterium]|jgi:hypothetical protein
MKKVFFVEIAIMMDLRLGVNYSDVPEKKEDRLRNLISGLSKIIQDTKGLIKKIKCDNDKSTITINFYKNYGIELKEDIPWNILKDTEKDALRNGLVAFSEAIKNTICH